MSSLTANFNELLERVRHGRDFMQASYEPIYYSNCKAIASVLESLRRCYRSMMFLSFFPISAYRGPCSMALTASSQSMDRRACCI